MNYKILFPKDLLKDFNKIPKIQVIKIKEAIDELKNFPAIKNWIKLTSHPLADYRLRIGDYRVLFDVDRSTDSIIILKIGHRKDIY